MFLWNFILFRSAAERSYLGDSEGESTFLDFLAAAADAARLPVHETNDLDDHDDLLSAQVHEPGSPRWSVCMASSVESKFACCH